MDKPVEETCASCSELLTEKNKCMCDPTVCFKCCKCPDDCTCGCRDKAAGPEEAVE